MTVEHVNLTGSQLHEPKGVSAASAGELGFASSNAVSWDTLVGQQSGTASTSSQLAFTGLSGYLMIRLTFVNLRRATSSTTLRMQFSSNNGSSYYSSAEYQCAYADNAANSFDAAETSVNLSGDNTNLFNNGVIEICNFNSAVETSWYGMMICSTSSAGGGTTTGQMISGVMDYGIDTAWNALRIYSSSGNLTSGSVYLEGFKGT